jgi:hypothetical protein
MTNNNCSSKLFLFRFAFEMIPRSQGGGDAGILLCMSRSIPTKTTKAARECEAVA